MSNISRPAAAVAALALSAMPFLLAPSPASADTAAGATKAAIEHDERLAAGGNHPSKAQIERQERAERDSATSGGSTERRPLETPSPSGGGGDPVVWQLALSAAAGAALTGGAVIAGRKVNHGHAVAH